MTSTSPLLFVGMGDLRLPWGDYYPVQTITVSGWAKQQLLNGYAGKYAYLEQYFDKAYKIDSNGNVTTNQTGLLFEYGEFLPTEPGLVALVTKPDIETGQPGTGVVNVIRLGLDVNHDGTMDLSLAGPDNTSQDRPMHFWLNSDCDWSCNPDPPSIDPGEDLDFAAKYPGEADCLNWEPRSIRDLEDWARLWVCGVPALTNGNYQIPRDGTPVSIDLATGATLAGEAGNLVVKCWTQDQGKRSGEKHDWRCGITSPGGGLALTNEQFAFLAPESGYEPSIEISMPTDRPGWNSQVDLKFYYRLADGRCGRMTFSMIAGGQHFCMIDSLLNPTGSRNLEPADSH